MNNKIIVKGFVAIILIIVVAVIARMYSNRHEMTQTTGASVQAHTSIAPPGSTAPVTDAHQ